MLVLTRKRDEQIRIGKDVTITVVRLAGGAVRIGIDAPPEVRIRRGELLARDPITGDAHACLSESASCPAKNGHAGASGRAQASPTSSSSSSSPRRRGQARPGTHKPR